MPSIINMPRIGGNTLCLNVIVAFGWTGFLYTSVLGWRGTRTFLGLATLPVPRPTFSGALRFETCGLRSGFALDSDCFVEAIASYVLLFSDIPLMRSNLQYNPKFL